MGSDNTVRGNVVEDVSGGGVELRGRGGGNRVEDNWVHDVGVDYRSSVGIAVEGSRNATVAHNQVNDVPSTGDLRPVPRWTARGEQPRVRRRADDPRRRRHLPPVRQGTSFDDGAVVRGNVVHHAGGAGLYPDVGADWVTLERNVLHGSDDAVAGVEPKRIRIANNYWDDGKPFWWPKNTPTGGITLTGNTLLPGSDPAASCRADAACADVLRSAGRRR